MKRKTYLMVGLFLAATLAVGSFSAVTLAWIVCTSAIEGIRIDGGDGVRRFFIGDGSGDGDSRQVAVADSDLHLRSARVSEGEAAYGEEIFVIGGIGAVFDRALLNGDGGLRRAAVSAGKVRPGRFLILGGDAGPHGVSVRRPC